MEKEKYFATSLSFGASSTTTTTSPPNMEIQIGHELNCSLDQLPNCFLNLNWENSMDQNVAFESALSSIVSSPNNSSVPPPGGESVVIRELIGRLGSICNSGEISPPQFGGGGGGGASSNYMNGNHSTNTSCYSTPLNSPPKLNLSMMDHHHHNQNRGGGNLQFQTNHHHPTLSTPPFPTDPGFAERAARFSCFGGSQFGGGFNETELPYSRSSPRIENGKLSRVASSQSLKVNGSQMGGGQELQDMLLDTEMRSVSGSGGGGGGDRKFSRFSRSSTPENGELNNNNAHEDSSLSEQIPVVETGLKVSNDVNGGRKRKAAATRGKAKEPPPSKDTTKAEVDDSNTKRSKSGDAAKAKTEQDTPKPPEPPKDYIHVRARRGQATDSHSLAERVRREKISERMKFLQDLVPGCNKVTGKAVMLDEIINYVQSLQRQVEFLSMKLATVNPRLDFNMEALLSKEILQSRGGSFPHSMYPLESSASAFPYGHQPQQQGPNLQNGLTNIGTENPLEAALRRNLSMQLPPLDGFCDSASQFWEDDLQSVVQMGFGQNQPQIPHGMPTNHMKVEL